MLIDASMAPLEYLRKADLCAIGRDVLGKDARKPEACGASAWCGQRD
jgi:hypothetical protein